MTGYNIYGSKTFYLATSYQYCETRINIMKPSVLRIIALDLTASIKPLCIHIGIHPLKDKQAVALMIAMYLSSVLHLQSYHIFSEEQSWKTEKLLTLSFKPGKNFWLRLWNLKQFVFLIGQCLLSLIISSFFTKGILNNH